MSDRLQRSREGVLRGMFAGRRAVGCLAFIAAGLLGGARVQAQIVIPTTWILPAPAAGNFTDNANWSTGSPSDGVSWSIDNGGTAQISSHIWSVDASIGFGSGKSGTLQILNGGQLSSGAGGGYEDLDVGRSGSGVLTVEAGGAAIVQNLFVAGEAGSTGTVEVNGGLLDVWKDLHIGNRGSGQLTLTGNGTVQSDSADIGHFAGSTGSATITSGQWTNTNAIFVGSEGNGTLAVAAQGRIASKSLYIGQNATGTAAVDGGNVTLTDTLAAGVNGSGNLSVSGAGKVTAAYVQVGLHTGASGTAAISGNAVVTGTQSVTIGADAGATGTLTLSDNATLSTPSLVVGSFGNATLNMGAGSRLNADNIAVAEISGTGVLNVHGGTVTTAAIVGGSSGAAVNLYDGTTLRNTNANGIIITGFSSGAFSLTGNITLETNAALSSLIESGMSGAGRLIKTGSGAVALTVASTYSGGTDIQGGRIDLAANNALGTGNVAIGTAEIRSTSNATIGPEIPLITVGANQTATFSAAAGTTFTLSPVSILISSGGTFRAGSSGNNGTVLFAPDLAAPVVPGTGSVSVEQGTLRAGNARLASLTSQAASTTVATGATLDFQDQLAGGSIANLQGNGTVQTGSNATTILKVSSGNFSGTISGAGSLLKDSAGTLLLSGNSTFGGGTTVSEGTLVVNGSLNSGLGAVDVLTGGTLGGTGFVGAVNLNGGSLAPGNSPGTLTTADLMWTEGAIVFELGANQAASDLILTGSLQGLAPPGSTYSFTFVDAGMVANTTYNLITFASSTIDVTDFRFTNGGGFDGTFAYSGNTLQFTVIPEPSTWALASLAPLLIALRRKRHTARGQS